MRRVPHPRLVIRFADGSERDVCELKVQKKLNLIYPEMQGKAVWSAIAEALQKERDQILRGDGHPCTCGHGCKPGMCTDEGVER